MLRQTCLGSDSHYIQFADKEKTAVADMKNWNKYSDIKTNKQTNSKMPNNSFNFSCNSPKDNIVEK